MQTLFPAFTLVLQMLVLGALIPLDAELVNDSSGYIDFPWSSFSTALSHQRTPGYPLFLACFGIAAAPLMHYLFFCAAVGTFATGLKKSGCSTWVSVVSASCLLYGSMPLEYVRFVATDALAAGFSVGAIGVLLCFGASPGKLWTGTILCILVAGCWLIRPAYLYMIPLVPVLGAAHCLLRRLPWQKQFVMLSLLCAVPLLGYCTVRRCVAGEFGVVSFGGYNLIGVTGQWLDRSVIAELPDELKKLSSVALDRMEKTTMPMEESDRLNYQRMEDRYDIMIWQIFTPAAIEVYGDDPVTINRKLRQLGTELVRKRPRNYAVWVAKAFRQAVRKTAWDLFGNTAFLGVFVVLVVSIQVSLISPKGESSVMPGNFPSGLLIMIGCIYWMANIGLVILVCPPLGRMTSAASVFIPPILAAVIAGEFLKRKSDRTPRHLLKSGPME